MSRKALALLPLLACGGGPDVSLEGTKRTEFASDEAPGRSFRRMDIDQLSASLSSVTGGLGWTELGPVEDMYGDVSEEEINLFEYLSLTLGKPDYLDSTVEDLAAGLLFQKFLDDASKSICSDLVEREEGLAAADRVLLVTVEPDTTLGSDPDAVAENISKALLRFHGRTIDPDDPRIQPWSALFGDVTDVSGAPMEGWRAVCIALLTHPDFYSY